MGEETKITKMWFCQGWSRPLKAEERAENGKSEIKELELEVRVVGNNFNYLEVSEENVTVT